MKKLTKLNLHDAQIMNDAELKLILGGRDGDGDDHHTGGGGYDGNCMGLKVGDYCDLDGGGYGICVPTYDPINYPEPLEDKFISCRPL